MMDLGTYFEREGRPAVRFVRTYPHSIDRVWTAVSNPDELRHWFPSSVEIDLRAGGVITFSGDPNIENSQGTVLACDPPRHLAFTWGGDELYFDLEPVDADHCRFTLTNVLEERNAAARNAAGWSLCLGALDKHLIGQHSATATSWQQFYETYVADGMPSGAWIPTTASG